MNLNEEKIYVGHRDQLLRVKKVELQDGKAAGVAMLHVYNRSGMNFSANISRGLDVTYLDFLGENIGFISPCGVVAPEYFDDKGLGFLKSFTAGFMTTCGLKMAGAPCEFEGDSYGLHGNISHTPAEDVAYGIDEESESIKITGTIRDAVVFKDKLVLHREINCKYKESKFTIKDKVVNEGYKTARHMMLYHFNIGYPILSENSEIFIPTIKTTPRNEHANSDLANCKNPRAPDHDYQEMCYYHTLISDENNNSTVAVFNKETEIGVAITFNTIFLDHFVQWKMMGAGDYVMGLEPCNSTIDGIEDAVSNGSMKYIKPSEFVEYSISFHMLKSQNEFDDIKSKYSASE